jgi:Na+/phosphate symporter
MSPIKHRRWRTAAAWAVSAALLIGYTLLDEPETAVTPEATEAGIQLPEEDRGKELIEVVEVRPGEPTPGSAVEVWFINTYQQKNRPLQAWLSVTDYRAGRQLPTTEMEVLHGGDDRIVVRVPRQAFEGRAKLRVGYNREERSKPYDLRLRSVSYRKLFREVVGGLALLFFGLRVMARGGRQYTGDRGNGLLARIGRRTPAAVGLGVAVGGITQFTTTAAGLVVGLVESHLIAVGPAVAVLLGAQLGAAVTPSVLGLISTREGLLVLTIGVLWLSLASDRRSEAFGKIILGCGLLFFGLHLLRQGFEPLVSNPELLPYIDQFDASTFSGRLSCVAAGVLLSAVLQGPAPVFVLVLGLAQSTGTIDLASGLAILSGTALGAAIGTQIVAGPFGSASAKVARVHLLLGLCGTLLLALTVQPLAQMADALVPGHVGAIAYGKKILYPHIGRHLVAGFALGQALLTVLLMAGIPAAVRTVERLMHRSGARRAVAPLAGNEGVNALRSGLTAVLTRYQGVLAAIHDLCLRGQRRRGRDCEHQLADTRVQLETLLGGALISRGDIPDMVRLRQAALATVQLQRALEELLQHGERSTEQNLALLPADKAWKMPPKDEATLKALHALLAEGIEELAEHIKNGTTPDLDDARAREIRLNATESESRQGLLVDADKGEPSGMLALRLNSSELINAYETVGNHLYRLNEALAAEVDQETPAQAI